MDCVVLVGILNTTYAEICRTLLDFDKSPKIADSAKWKQVVKELVKTQAQICKRTPHLWARIERSLYLGEHQSDCNVFFEAVNGTT